MKIKFEWEDLGNYPEPTFIAKVIGGWLIMMFCEHKKEGSNNSSMIFIADPEHKWEIE